MSSKVQSPLAGAVSSHRHCKLLAVSATGQASKLWFLAGSYGVVLAINAQTNTTVALPSTANLFDQIIATLNSLYGLPGHFLVGVTCIVVGYTLRFYRKFPNDAIPLVCILWGMIFNPLVADERAAGTSMRLWLVRNILIGLIVGAGAWVLHRYVIRKFEERIPILGAALADADKRSDQAQICKLASKVLDKPDEPVVNKSVDCK